MRLEVTTPTQTVVRADGVIAVRAEDATGAFGILPGHADFLTVLVPTVVSWRGESGDEGHVAVRGGVFSVLGGDTVQVATPEAFVSDDIDRLEAELLKAVAAAADIERTARSEAAGLQLSAARYLQRYLRAAGGGIPIQGERR